MCVCVRVCVCVCVCARARAHARVYHFVIKIRIYAWLDWIDRMMQFDDFMFLQHCVYVFAYKCLLLQHQVCII